MKKEFFAIYDLGIGAQCVIIMADSLKEIQQKLQFDVIFDSRPPGVTDEIYKNIRERLTFDIDEPADVARLVEIWAS